MDVKLNTMKPETVPNLAPRSSSNETVPWTTTTGGVAWQSAGDALLREEVAQQIENILRSKCRDGRTSLIPRVVRGIESKLYRSALCREEYSDTTTLASRIIETMEKSKQRLHRRVTRRRQARDMMHGFTELSIGQDQLKKFTASTSGAATFATRRSRTARSLASAKRREAVSAARAKHRGARQPQVPGPIVREEHRRGTLLALFEDDADSLNGTNDLASVLHATECQSSECREPGCTRLKKLIAHRKECTETSGCCSCMLVKTGLELRVQSREDSVRESPVSGRTSLGRETSSMKKVENADMEARDEALK